MIIMPIMIEKYAYVMMLSMTIMVILIVMTIIMHRKKDMLK